MTLREKLVHLDVLNHRIKLAENSVEGHCADFVEYGKLDATVNALIAEADAFAIEHLHWPSRAPVMNGVWIHDFIMQTLLNYNDDLLRNRDKS